MMVKILASIGSIATIGFGVWHFFVPKAYQWYSYINADASELVTAVRATNVFFSLGLVLIGLTNLVFLYAPQSNTFAVKVMLAVCCVLWAVRIIMQLIYPQGSISAVLQYGMLAGFIAIFTLFAVSLVLTLTQLT